MTTLKTCNDFFYSRGMPELACVDCTKTSPMIGILIPLPCNMHQICQSCIAQTSHSENHYRCGAVPCHVCNGDGTGPGYDRDPWNSILFDTTSSRLQPFSSTFAKALLSSEPPSPPTESSPSLSEASNSSPTYRNTSPTLVPSPTQ